jgi:antitoxin (DNA-binding transcriptional repressor) of toxin-antitoxin stability system
MAIKFSYILLCLGMAIVMSLHEVKDQLSGVINRLIESGEAVEITKHGKVVAVLTAPARSGVILGVAKRSDGCAPGLDDLSWTTEELIELSGRPILPDNQNL